MEYLVPVHKQFTLAKRDGSRSFREMKTSFIGDNHSQSMYIKSSRYINYCEITYSFPSSLQSFDTLIAKGFFSSRNILSKLIPAGFF